MTPGALPYAPGAWETYTVRIPSGTLAGVDDYTGALDLVQDYDLPYPQDDRPWHLHAVYTQGVAVTGIEVRLRDAGPTLGGFQPEQHTGIAAITPSDWDGSCHLTLRGGDGATYLTWVRVRAQALNTCTCGGKSSARIGGCPS